MDNLLILADKLSQLRDQKAALEAELDGIKKQIDNTDYQLSELMATEEVQNFTRGNHMYYLNTKLRASATAGVKEELYAALREQGYGDLVYETVNANSLSSFVKERMEENSDSLPDWLIGLVNVFEKTTVGVRKAPK